MTRLIDADELKEKMCRIEVNTREKIIEMIDNAPTVERPTGEWIKTTWFNEIYGYELECPFCHEQSLSTHENFCSNCGAKLTKEADNE